MKISALIFTAAALWADEGMWTFNNFPVAKLKKEHGFAPTQQWLDRVRQSSVRLATGCSSSFVSGNGLVMTNHHCASSCIRQLSTAQKDYSAAGFYAAATDQEMRCPEEEANVLIEITDVTARLQAKLKGLTDAAAFEARKAEQARIEKECATSDAVRCDVVSLYGGGRYDLYKYRRYQDVRLVFAPETAIAFFGGDPDNFMFPRYDLDVSFFRVYENGQPLKTPNHLGWSANGAREGELTFVSGHPGTTDRLFTMAMLEAQRDLVKPSTLLHLAEYRGILTEFQTRGAEQARIAEDDLFDVENSFKAHKGEFQALLSPVLMNQKRAAEQDFQRRVKADPKLASQYGNLWRDIAAAENRRREIFAQYRYLELRYGFRSDLYRHALRLVRMAAEYSKKNEERLPEYTDARKPEARQRTLSTAPIYPELEIETLTFSLTKLREELGADDPVVRKLFGKRSPRDIATEAVKGSSLGSVEVRKAMLEGGRSAIDASIDPMIALAKTVDPLARAIRKKYEDEVESVQTRRLEDLARARFAVYGTSIYPDATFSLRLNYGTVKGWMENGKPVSPFTIFGGAFERATGRPPFELPESWLKAKGSLDMQTPFNLSTTNDIIGGNSGSPMINQAAEVVGLVFDGNIHSLGGSYGFDESVNRTVAVDSRALMQALDKIYNARRIIDEIRGR